MRKISEKERQLVLYLLENAGIKINIPQRVRTMKDGEMGSISFDLTGTQQRETQIAAGNFKDKDGTLVDFELTADKSGNLFELDLWKVDFSKLIALPDLNEIKITTPNNS